MNHKMHNEMLFLLLLFVKYCYVLNICKTNVNNHDVKLRRKNHVHYSQGSTHFIWNTIILLAAVWDSSHFPSLFRSCLVHCFLLSFHSFAYLSRIIPHIGDVVVNAESSDSTAAVDKMTNEWDDVSIPGCTESSTTTNHPLKNWDKKQWCCVLCVSKPEEGIPRRC